LVLNEFLVALGLKDNMTKPLEKATKDADNNVGKLVGNFAKNFAKAGMAVTGFITVAATGLLKFTNSLVKADDDLLKFARNMGLSQAEAYKVKSALDIMGKSMEEIALDPNLLKEFEQLKKNAATLELPDMTGALKPVRETKIAFNEIKQTAANALQWVGYYFLKYVQTPIENLKKISNNINETIKKNIPAWTSNIAKVLSWLVRLGGTIIRGAGVVFNVIKRVFDMIPGNVKTVTAVLSGLFTFLKMSPLGKMITIISAALMLLDDFFTFLDGGDSLLSPVWEILTGFFDGFKDSGKGALSFFTEDFLPKLTEKIREVFPKLIETAMSFVKPFIEFAVKALDGIIKFLLDAIPEIIEIAGIIFTTLFDAFMDYLPELIILATSIIQTLIDGLIKAIPKLTNTVINIIEKVVGAIVRNFPEILKAGIDLIRTLIQGIVKAVPLLVSSVVDLIPVIMQALIEAVPMIWEAGGQIIGALIDGILGGNGEMSEAFGEIGKILGEIFGEFGKTILEVFNSVLPVILDLLGTLIPVLMDIVKTILPPLLALLKAILIPILDLVKKVMPILTTSIKVLLPILKILMSIIEGVAKVLINVLGVAINIVTGAIESMIKFFNGFITFITGVFTGDWGKAWNGIKEMFSAVWTQIKNVFKSIWDGITGHFSIIGDTFKNIFGGVVDFFKNAFTVIGDYFGISWDDIKDKFGSAIFFFKGIWNGIKNTFGSVADWFRNIFTDAWNAVKNVFSSGGKIFEGIKDGISDVFKNVVNGIIGGLSKVIAIPLNAINAVLRKLKEISILGIKPFDWINEFDIPEFPKLEKGGVLEKGQTGYLEGKGTEAVVPLEKNTEWIKKVAGQFNREVSVNTPENADKLKNISENINSALNKLSAIIQSFSLSVDKTLINGMNKFIESGAKMTEFFDNANKIMAQMGMSSQASYTTANNRVSYDNRTYDQKSTFNISDTSGNPRTVADMVDRTQSLRIRNMRGSFA